MNPTSNKAGDALSSAFVIFESLQPTFLVPCTEVAQEWRESG